MVFVCGWLCARLFSEHIQRLAKVVGANHHTLQIPDVYLKEAPWPSAQAEIRTISAYKASVNQLAGFGYHVPNRVGSHKLFLIMMF